jgi:hypothetical protein
VTSRCGSSGIDGDISYDGRFVPVGLPEGSSAVWDSATGGVIGLTPPGANLVRYVDVAGDGRHVTYSQLVGEQVTLQQWDAAGA